ncbi:MULTISPECIES: single-stranded DNA-binding protein [Staphylococcus]|jgi:single-strand DNA-binding protein|uniref:single-stranded DNA-binding protein n=1 Tax=Staphylococcus TaxID=1279 RepID=UPI0006617DF0|nr:MULTISPECIES: single-stranded DNA-binding protein [Staphylococcus]OFM64607.1 single-stranded DNA-binding protein [Staphylococcus sp. HMSC062C01]SII34271.1 single-stranded DNA-binding protein [Mycobacteroides abscessus subsp. abscessus]GGO38089.1 single-stranded DNA-binding protein [Plantactinospora veratri]KMU54823.1 Single-stranded DNA-binding protein [Staphylococcus hominis]KMU56400.1 Single-stranded DNA-binding protein [Staphylococcus hominis]
MINRVVLVGRLTKDPEYRSTPSGVSVATFTLAVNRTFTNAQGEREADFINVVVFRRQAENVNNYLSKGSLAGVDGRIQSRSYENQEGRRIFVTEVVADSVQFLEPKNAQGGQRNQGNNDFQDYGQGFGGSQSGQNTSYNNNNNRASNNNQSDNPFANANGPIDISDDDLPF